MSYLINIIVFIIIGIIVFFSLKKEKRKEDKYFGKEVPLSKKELKILEKYKAEYSEIKFDLRLPTFEKNGVELIDICKSATEMIYEHPIRTKKEKEEIKKGDYVKLKFMDKENDVERIWVEIVEKDRSLLKGILRNDSFSNNDLVSGKEFWLHYNHIFEIDKK